MNEPQPARSTSALAVGLVVSIVITILLFYRHSRLAAGLLVPYLLWVTFASILNFTIWSINRVG